MAEEDSVLPRSITAAACCLAELDLSSKTDRARTLAALREVIEELEPKAGEAIRPLAQAIKRLEASIDVEASELEEPVRAVAVALDALMDDLPMVAGQGSGSLEDLSAELDPEMLGEFVNESRELLEQSENALLDLESAPGDEEAINTVFRAFHTIKGTAACLGLDGISSFAHHAESLLSRVREGELAFGGEVSELALRCRDALVQMTEAVAQAAAGEIPSLPVHEDLLRALSSIESPSQVAAPTAAAKTDTGAANPAGVPSNAGTDSVRVRTDRLDRLIDMVGELVVAQSMVSEQAGGMSVEHQELIHCLDHVTKIVRDLRDLGLTLRMVPLRGVYRRLQRVVRDVTQRSGKNVTFLTEGEGTEIDRNMVDLIADPLIHMVRNAVDHGIEPGDVRRAAGKPEAGTIRVSARHAGGSVQIRMEDDGRGLDREGILKRARERGLISPGESLSDAEVHGLLFQPGFSTAESVTDISGRGVGLDVVRRSIEALQGRIEISSTRGRGTVFSIKLPLTLAIADGMQVRCGNQRFIVPTMSIQMSLRPDSSLQTVQGRGELLPLRDEMLPVFRLSRLFDIDSAVCDPSKGLLVVLDDGDQRFALMVDELLSQQQVVVKPLNSMIGKVPGVSGAAVLGDGSVGLILDPGELADLGRNTSETHEVR